MCFHLQFPADNFKENIGRNKCYKKMGEKSQKEREKTHEENIKKISALNSTCNQVAIYYGILSCN